MSTLTPEQMAALPEWAREAVNGTDSRAFMQGRNALQRLSNELAVNGDDDCGMTKDLIDVVEVLAHRLLSSLADALLALAEARRRRYGTRQSDSHCHTTACSIWGDDGQGGTGGEFPEPLPCNCGALINFYKARLADKEAELSQAEHSREVFHEKWSSMRRLYETTLDNLERSMRHTQEAQKALAEARRDSKRIDQCESTSPYFSVHGDSNWISILGAVPKGGVEHRSLRNAIDEFFCLDAARSAGEETKA